MNTNETTTLTGNEPTTFIVGIVLKQDMPAYWESAAVYLKEAIEQGFQSSIDALRQQADRDHVQIWVVTRNQVVVGAAATSVIDYDEVHRSLRVIALAGDHFKQWEARIIQLFEHFAKNVGAVRIEAVGRKGWGPRLEQYGFKQKFVTFIKEVPNEQVGWKH